jgi:hypothetical protein
MWAGLRGHFNPGQRVEGGTQGGTQEVGGPVGALRKWAATFVVARSRSSYLPIEPLTNTGNPTSSTPPRRIATTPLGANQRKPCQTPTFQAKHERIRLIPGVDDPKPACTTQHQHVDVGVYGPTPVFRAQHQCVGLNTGV